MALADEIREACARVSQTAEHVAIRTERIPAYARRLESLPSHPPPSVTLEGREQEVRAAFHLACDVVNFGSGWFPTLRKRDGRSGSYTVMLGLRDLFAAPGGGWDAGRLAALEAADVALVLGQDREHELMALYAEHLRELGTRVLESSGGSFVELASRPGLAAHLASWPGFADVSSHRELRVPFFKRAQLTAYDMACAGFVAPGAEGDLTMFADNLVPHVLRVDGLLEYDSALIERIDGGGLLEHGEPAEVEIRALALHAVELIRAMRPDFTAPAVDHALWHRGQGIRYKAIPRHRARCRAY